MIRRSSVCILALPLAMFLSACTQQHPPLDNTRSQQKTTTKSQETAFLNSETGFVGDVLGAEVTSIFDDTEHGLQIIEVTIPIDPNSVDLVRVVSESGFIIPQDRTAEILRDYENDNVGIKLYLPKQKNWAFKLKLIDQTEPD